MKLFLEKALKGKKYKIKPLTSEGSDRKYFRIIMKDRSHILAHSPILQQKKFLNRWKDFYEGGLNVPKVYSYQAKLDGDIPVGIENSGWKGLADRRKEPKSYGKIKSNGYKNQSGFLLLEDLGDQSLEKEVLTNQPFSFTYYYQALDQIIKLSSMVDLGSLKRKALKRTKKNFHTSSLVFTEEQFFKEMLWTEKYLIGKVYQIKWEKDFQAKCRKEWQHICKTLSSFSFLPAHRDYHSRNIFIKNKKTYIIDFQDAGFFPLFYDVVSLLYDVYVHPKMTNKEREKLLRYFVSRHPGLKSVEEIQWEVAITTAQRLFKACGSFAGFSSLKKQNTHLKYIVPALKILRKELQNLKEYPCFLSLVNMLLDRNSLELASNKPLFRRK